MRTIDADVLKIDIVEEGQRSRRYKLGEIWELNRDEIYKVIDKQPTIESEPHWIPCSERLPKEDGDYIVTFEKWYASDYGLDPIGIAPFEVDCEGFGFWQEQFDMHTLGSLGSDWVDINVIAWMPLPEAYKEGGVV